MDEMTPFLRKIAENPGDDAPRLVFADWLDEYGGAANSARAEFIRLQIELENADPSDDGYAEKTARMRRCGVFTKKGKHRFFDYLPTKKCKIGFRRGLIEAINTADADKIDASGFDLIPLQALSTGNKHIEKFKGFTKLKWFEYFNGYGGDPGGTPARLLTILGSKGWFKELETLSLPNLSRACLEAGVIPQFDLPKLRNFFLYTDAFYNLGVFVENADAPEDDEYGDTRSWNGLPDYLPKNAIPSKKCPLERFVWHCDDDSDFYRDGNSFWAGPTMESLLAHLKPHKLKQVEVAVDWDDHEGGGEGVMAARYEQNPLKLCPTLEHVTVENDGLRLLKGPAKKLKGLRVYAESDFPNELFTLLGQPVCSALESLHIEIRDGWREESANGPSNSYPKLKHLWGLPAEFSNCQFPNLVSLRGVGSLKTVVERKWPNLQWLEIALGHDGLPHLKALAKSDCCPNLTTLVIDGYSVPSGTDFSFLADCPHMPHLSLIRSTGYPVDQTWVVDGGELISVRDDVMLDELKPTTVYRIAEVF